MHGAVAVRRAPEYGGWGLFAEGAIAAGEFVAEYVGVITPDAEAAGCAGDGYAMRYPVGGTAMRISSRDVGNVARFINHSAGPNTDVFPLLVDGAFHMVVVATLAVRPGDQLFFDYGNEYWAARPDQAR